MSDLAPSVQVGEIPPKVRNIQGVSTSTAALVGLFSKGPIGVPTFVSGPDEMAKKFGGANQLGVSALCLDKWFKNGGSRIYIVRTAHYTDPATPATLTAVKASKTIDDRQPNAGIKASGSIIVANNAIEEYTQAQGYVEILNNTPDAGDKVTINGVDFEQGVDFTFGGTLALTAIALRDAINASLNPAIDGVLTAAIDPGNSARVLITAVAFGTSGNAITLAETDGATNNFSLSGATLTGGVNGDDITVGNSGLLQFGDEIQVGLNAAATAIAIRDAINLAATNVDAVIDPSNSAKVNLEASVVGTAGNSIAIAKTDPDNDLTLSGATLTGGANTDTQNAIIATADDGEGIHANGRIVRISNARNGLADHFKLDVLSSLGEVLDSFDNLNLITTSANYAETRINGKQQKLIRVADQMSSNTGSNKNLPLIGDHALAGGNDGLVGLNDQDFIGSAAGKTGIFALDSQEDKFAMAAMPDRVTVAAQQAFYQRAELKKNYLFFGDFPNALDSQGAVEYKNDNGLSSEYMALHWPNLKVQDLNPSNIGVEVIIPNSVAMMALYARTDGAPGKGVAKTAAGVNDGRIFDIVGFENEETQIEGNRELLFPEGINPLWSEQGVGPINDGGRLSKLDGLVPNVNERRVFIFVETSVKLGIRFARHENIDLKLFNSINASITVFLTRFWRQGGLKGRVSSEAFYVDTSSGVGTINPPSEEQANRVNTEVGLATKKPGYFIKTRFTVDQRQLLEEISSGQ